MSEAKHTAPLPRAPHTATLRNPAHTILDASGTRLLCWCPIHQCGAIYHTEARIWSMEAPIGFGEFLTALRARNILPADGAEDLAQWIEACTPPVNVTPTGPGGRC
jgi:hypothetical protein